MNEFGPEGLDSSKATSSQALSLASSGSAGAGAAVPPALASDPLVSWIMASQPSSKTRRGSGTSALRSQGSGSTQVQDWELNWADLKLQRAVGSGSYGKVGGSASGGCVCFLAATPSLQVHLVLQPKCSAGEPKGLPARLRSHSTHYHFPLIHRCTLPAGAPHQWQSRYCWCPVPLVPTLRRLEGPRRRSRCRLQRWLSWKQRRGCWPA